MASPHLLNLNVLWISHSYAQVLNQKRERDSTTRHINLRKINNKTDYVIVGLKVLVEIFREESSLSKLSSMKVSDALRDFPAFSLKVRTRKSSPHHPIA